MLNCFFAVLMRMFGGGDVYLYDGFGRRRRMQKLLEVKEDSFAYYPDLLECARSADVATSL